MTKSVCVFCGARSGAHPAYETAATQTGEMLAQQGWRLVYGAGDVGLMGAVARGVQDNGGETFGVIPDHIVQMEIGKKDLTSYVVTETMHERKSVMFMNCDAVVMLPGGVGSLEEMFEVLTWRQIGMHEKPIYLLNTEGYWDPLRHLLDHIVAQGFAGTTLNDSFQMPATVADLQAALRSDFS